MSKMELSKPLIFMIMASVVISAFVSGYIGYRNWISASTNAFQLELFKTCLQFLVIGVAGAGVAMLFRSYENAREKSQAQMQEKRIDDERRLEVERTNRSNEMEFIRRQYYDILDTYNKVKLIRRSMRAKSKLDGQGQDVKLVMQRSDYETLFLRLEDAQLELERLKKVIRYNGQIFDKNVGGTETFYQKLDRSEKYIRDILKEFEYGLHHRSDDGVTIDKDSLALGFIASGDDMRHLILPRNGKDMFFSPMGELEEEAIRQMSKQAVG